MLQLVGVVMSVSLYVSIKRELKLRKETVFVEYDKQSGSVIFWWTCYLYIVYCICSVQVTVARIFICIFHSFVCGCLHWLCVHFTIDECSVLMNQNLALPYICSLVEVAVINKCIKYVQTASFDFINQLGNLQNMLYYAK